MRRVTLPRTTNGLPSASTRGRPRRLADPDAVISYLTGWAEAARRSGRAERANRLELLIWEAYGNKLAGAISGTSVLI